MLRRIVPALGVIALLPLSANAQEIAKGVDLSGYVDSYFVAETNNVENKASTTDFKVEGVIKLGWAITDRASATIATRTNTMTSTNTALLVPVAYGTVKATDKVNVSFGKSYGPFGYYSPWATGLSTVTGVDYIPTIYTVNPIGVWADFTVNDQLTITGIVADGFSGDKPGKPSSVSPGLDVVYKVIPELALNLEGYIDPNGGGEKQLDNGDVDANNRGDVFYLGFNAEYKKDAITAAGEFLVQEVHNKNSVALTTVPDNQRTVAWAAFVNYNLGSPQEIPMSVTGQLSQLRTGVTSDATGAPVEADWQTKAQVALLTNPIGSADFGLNFEVYMTANGESNNNAAGDHQDSTYGLAIEGLYVLP